MHEDLERLRCFHVLYTAVLRQSFDREEFVADDLYAFQALERALRSGNQELCGLAAHLQALRQAAMDKPTGQLAEPLGASRRLNTLPHTEVGSQSGSHASEIAGAWPSSDRRSGEVRLSPQEMTRVTYFQRLYRQEFGRPLNVTRFTMDDGYGREILEESLGAANQELVSIAKYFVDEDGRPRQHRRGIVSADS